MPEGRLDRDQVHAAQVELGRAEMAQDVGRDHIGPVRQVRLRGAGQGGTQRLVPDPGSRAVGVLAFRRQQRDAGAGVIVAELCPHVLDEPAQRRPGVVDQRDHPLPRARAAGALAVPDVELAEPPQVPLDVGQIELARLVDPQPDLSHQPAGGVVTGRGGELPAGRQLPAPPREQPPDLLRIRRDPQPGLLPAAGPVHLVDRALDDASGHLVDLGPVPQLQEQEIRLQRLRPRQPGAPGSAAEHLAEVRVRVRRLHVPQRPAEPGPDLLQVHHVRADRPVRQMVLRLLAHNAEHWLSNQLNAYLRDDDEYRAITRETIIRGLAGTITYQPQAITVELQQPRAPRVARALAMLIEEINYAPP